MQNKKIYEYIIIGAGVAGASIANELKKHSNNILIIEKNKSINESASAAAGGFLSPLLGKSNKFKTLVNNALVYSTKFYKKNMANLIDQCGTLRIPKDEIDEKKFQEYMPFIDFEYEMKEGGCYFPYASIVKSQEICKLLMDNITIQYDYEVKNIEKLSNLWSLDNKYYTKKLILATGASNLLIDEFYLNIRAVWGQRIDISTTNCISFNYHKECSVSRAIKIDNDYYKVSIGATHHRFVKDKKIVKSDTVILLKKAQDIIELKDIKVLKEYAGARASSSDYFPLLGKIIDSNKTLNEFPYLKKGTNVQENRFTRYDNLYIFNGLGGRGFVLAPYLANKLCNLIINDIDVDMELNVNRLFKRAVKKMK